MTTTQGLISETTARFATDVKAGLDRSGQKELPSKYLYDPVGFTLFEAICQLPEYGLTRADERLLRLHAPEIAQRLPAQVVVSELGSGSGKKTRAILEAVCARAPVSYYPIEISATALALCERELSDISCVSVVGIEREYLDGLLEVSARRPSGCGMLVLFLGSTIGNFDSGAEVRFLQSVRRTLTPGDALLLGADLLKPLKQLLAAYDDPLGVTASFNLNLLARINRELEADFKLDQFKHVAKFNQQTRSVEMHLRSRKAQTVTIPGAELTVRLAEGETIWTESSHKFTIEELNKLADNSGFRCEAQWIDQQWPFAENLYVAI